MLAFWTKRARQEPKLPATCSLPLAPIFIIGSYRSATSVTTWALGQHPNIFPLEETHFLYKLAVDLDYLYEIGSGLGDRSFLGAAGLRRRDFYQVFGQACDGLVQSSRDGIIRRSSSERHKASWSDNFMLARAPQDPKRRWVDGTPENSHFVYPLLRLFPGAKFIHILRNPKRVATSLMHFSSVASGGPPDYREQEAYDTWAGLVRSAALAEMAFGPKRVLRIDHGEIERDPETVVRRCLDFVGEPYDSNCTLPFRSRINGSRYDDPGDCSIEANLSSPEAHVRDAFTLYQAALSGRVPGVETPVQAFRALKSAFRQYADSLRPSTNQWMSDECARLSAELSALRTHAAKLEGRLKAIERPLRIVSFGPDRVRIGEAFNLQPTGDSALWLRTENAGPNAVIELGGRDLETVVDCGGTLLTACVPADLLSRAGELQLFVKDSVTGERVGPELLRVAG